MTRPWDEEEDEVEGWSRPWTFVGLRELGPVAAPTGCSDAADAISASVLGLSAPSVSMGSELVASRTDVRDKFPSRLCSKAARSSFGDSDRLPPA